MPQPQVSSCPRVNMRIFCNECGYPRGEARYANDKDQVGIPHVGEVVHLICVLPHWWPVAAYLTKEGADTHLANLSSTLKHLYVRKELTLK